MPRYLVIKSYLCSSHNFFLVIKTKEVKILKEVTFCLWRCLAYIVLHLFNAKGMQIKQQQDMESEIWMISPTSPIRCQFSLCAAEI